jgi:3-isopropylmalate/(R)-2-methylmalate dehydratase small subunit
MNIGLLPVTVSEAFLDKIFKAIEADPKAEFEVSLTDQTVTILASGEKESFAITGYKKHNLMNGYDDIDFLHSMESEIREFAQKHAV